MLFERKCNDVRNKIIRHNDYTEAERRRWIIIDQYMTSLCVCVCGGEGDGEKKINL